VNKELFQREIADVVPLFVSFETRPLPRQFMGRKKMARLIVQRVKLRALAFKPISPAKAKI